ncbi:MAG: U32 family peptidase [Kiritimatiellae bacterium]|nr:U32 family peptidase [Kiritimatiellia bacterium]
MKPATTEIEPDTSRKVPDTSGVRHPAAELLAPAGSFEAALAAFQYGADAIYLGLSNLSARAEAVNFTPEQLLSITAYAHALSPRRAVYVAVNTLVRDDEVQGVLDALDACSEAGVDGVILQDFAVFTLLRRNFPNLKAHASTQMAVHNLEGAQAIAELGFSRVVLARELSFAEIRDITAKAPIETEVFIHGALCYGYSGLCLFSALRTGRSGNRGRCAYCCRSEYQPVEGRERAAFPFSMRDLFLYDSVRDLRDAGVASLKIEGRMKSPLYVAAVTDLYRRKLDGLLEDADAARTAISDMQTVFSRPATRLYFDGKADPEGIVDAAAVGHRGAHIGHVHSVRRDREGRRWLCFAPQRPLEAHDGLQIEFDNKGGSLRNGRPYGFAIETMRLAGETRSVFTAPSRSRVEILLPKDAPTIPVNAKVYCASSQAVHRRFAVAQPRASELRASIPITCHVRLEPDTMSCSAECAFPPLHASASVPCSLTPAQKPELTEQAVMKAFSRLGETRWSLASLAVDDPNSLYAPASVLNDLRRRLCDELDAAYDAARTARRATLGARASSPRSDGAPAVATSVKITIDHPVDAFPDYDETVVALTAASCAAPNDLLRRLEDWRKTGKPIRVATPLIMRGEEPARCEEAVRRLIDAGFRDWECADLAGLHMLRRIAGDSIAITADGSFYAFNAIAAQALHDMGIVAAVAPAETEDEQILSAAPEVSKWLIVPIRWRPPLFISETRPLVPWEPREARHMELADRRGWRCTVDASDGRWLTRDTKPIDRSKSLAAFRAAGYTLFRYDFTDLGSLS